MTAIVFSTPGELDLRAITTFGVNAKPNTTNPIGYFGTGLKYAIAVLVRKQIPVSLWIGKRQYEFYSRQTDFRDKKFSQVMMRQRNSLMGKWRYIELPFTTELGKNWELWQVFRELESNTRDENGTTAPWNNQHPDIPLAQLLDVRDGMTHIVVSDTAFTDCYYKRDEVFLPGGLTFREGNDSVQVFEQASNYLYYRGLRVMTLPKPGKFTYNILSSVELTEDRTVKSEYLVDVALTSYVAQSKDPALIAKVLDADPKTSWEGTWAFDYLYSAPSDVFKEVMAKKRQRNQVVLPSAVTYFERHYPTPQVPKDGEVPLSTQLEMLAQRLYSKGQIITSEYGIMSKCVDALQYAEDKHADDFPF